MKETVTKYSHRYTLHVPFGLTKNGRKLLSSDPRILTQRAERDASREIKIPGGRYRVTRSTLRCQPNSRLGSALLAITCHSWP